MAQKSNLTIEVLSIIGGVLTAIFFLGFLVLSSILRSETSCLIAGSILIITTLFVNRLLTKPFLARNSGSWAPSVSSRYMLPIQIA